MVSKPWLNFDISSDSTMQQMSGIDAAALRQYEPPDYLPTSEDN
jgi:hypothetical protein